MDEQAPDGSPVAVFARLPAEPDLSVVRRYAAGRRSVLDLGCGTGRIADPLVGDGHDVVAVDESPAMLQLVRAATPVRGNIASLQLGRRFDLVLLLSQLVNSPQARVLLATAARHLAPDGLLLLQPLPPGHQWQDGTSTLNGISITLSEIHRDKSVIRATTTYDIGEQQWRQTWTAQVLTDADLNGLLGTAGLRLLSASDGWATATPGDEPNQHDQGRAV